MACACARSVTILLMVVVMVMMDDIIVHTLVLMLVDILLGGGHGPGVEVLVGVVVVVHLQATGVDALILCLTRH